MGNLNPNQNCCRNYCKNENELVDNYLSMNMDKSSVKKVIKIQTAFRRFRVRNKIRKSRSRNIISNNTLSNNFSSNNHLISTTPDPSHIPGVIVDPNSEVTIHPKVAEIEKKLGPFKLNEKESCIINSNLANLHYKTAIYYKDNTFYKGYLNKDYLKEGYGSFYLPDGSKYEGFFKDDMMWGRGRLINVTNRFYYEGNFISNKANGFGKYVTFEGSIYVGYWQDDKQHGLGEEVFPDGSRYEGNFEAGKKQGKGVFIFKDGSKYEGEFFANVLCGYGSYAWNDGKIYQGTWKENKMDGKGIFLWTDKKKYIGQYKQDKKHGFGVFFWPDDKKYEGMWENGKQHGYGIITQSNVSQLGQWANGKIVHIIKDTDEQFDVGIKFINEKKKESKVFEMSEFKLRI